MPRERDAAFCRAISGSCRMQEDGAPGPLNPRPSVVVQYDDHIIKRILAPKTFGAGRIGMTHKSIIVAVADGITPSVVDLQGAHLQPCPRPLHAIGTVEHQQRPPRPTRRGAVALTLSGRSPAPPQGTRQHECPHGKKAAGRRARTRMNPERTTIVRHRITRNALAPTPDCHLFPGSCIHWATSDMLHPQNSPIGSVAT